jgi:hypothetical protein
MFLSFTRARTFHACILPGLSQAPAASPHVVATRLLRPITSAVGFS